MRNSFMTKMVIILLSTASFSGGLFADEFAKTAKPSQSNPSWKNFLPFGGGQFANGNVALGSVFAASQATALGYYFYNENLQKRYVRDSDDAISGFDDEKRRKTGDDSQAYQNAIDAYQTNAQAESAKIHRQAMAGLYVFGGLYATSIIESLLNRPVVNESSFHADVKFSPGGSTTIAGSWKI